LLEVLVCWCSKSQKDVTFSRTEAEYVAISEAVKEVKFIYYLLFDFHIKVNLPITTKIDNIGAIFIDGFIKVEFVQSVENDADIFTKNVSHDLDVNTRRIFWLTQERIVWVDLFRVGRVLEISFKSNHIVLFV
jgi:hypothetical protein